MTNLIFILFFSFLAIDELKTDFKNPIDQCNTLNPVSDFNRSRLDNFVVVEILLLNHQ